MPRRVSLVSCLVLGLLGLTAGVSGALKRDVVPVAAWSDTDVRCEQDLSVAHWAWTRTDGRVDGLTVVGWDPACAGLYAAVSVSDLDGDTIAYTEGQIVAGGTEPVEFSFSPVRPCITDIESLEIFVVGPDSPPEVPVPFELSWDGAGDQFANTESTGPVFWDFSLAGNLKGLAVEVTAEFEHAGSVGPVPARHACGDPLTVLNATLATPEGDRLIRAVATLSEPPDPLLVGPTSVNADDFANPENAAELTLTGVRTTPGG